MTLDGEVWVHVLLVKRTWCRCYARRKLVIAATIVKMACFSNFTCVGITGQLNRAWMLQKFASCVPNITSVEPKHSLD